ncbi:hypothetical protein O181_020060 [Austropuccinia psidii MF-1]|uniref:Uncharacterized protein n=1 Tax=Austropuccinia psidii MF-1 TaxID=1389203 RepID=A0A9Q3CD16_9BASI|nr:hypothetical protein [Austropuccinia psidii MF-1]
MQSSPSNEQKLSWHSANGIRQAYVATALCLSEDKGDRLSQAGHLRPLASISVLDGRKDSLHQAGKLRPPEFLAFRRWSRKSSQALSKCS